MVVEGAGAERACGQPCWINRYMEWSRGQNPQEESGGEEGHRAEDMILLED